MKVPNHMHPYLPPSKNEIPILLVTLPTHTKVAIDTRGHKIFKLKFVILGEENYL